MRFAKSTGCFYPEDFGYSVLPADIIDVPQEDFDAAIARNPGDTLDVINGQVVVIPKPAPTLAELIVAVVKQIDSDVDTIYTAALGNRATEYAQAEAEAQSYKDCGYADDVPAYVQAWATATGYSAAWAADNILTTAAAWRTAQTAIRANRLACKEAARNASDVAALTTVATEWQAFVVAIKAQLGVAP